MSTLNLHRAEAETNKKKFVICIIGSLMLFQNPVPASSYASPFHPISPIHLFYSNSQHMHSQCMYYLFIFWPATPCQLHDVTVVPKCLETPDNSAHPLKSRVSENIWGRKTSGVGTVGRIKWKATVSWNNGKKSSTDMGNPVETGQKMEARGHSGCICHHWAIVITEKSC